MPGGFGLRAFLWKDKMANFIDLTGRRFGQITVLNRVFVTKKRTHWKCRCDCGKETVIAGMNLGNGHTTSCGCLRIKHGKTNTPEFSSWSAMMDRCYCETNKGYHRYGGRGIAVCERWRNDFQAFLEDMGPRPKGHSIGRINNNLGYFPENCQWQNAKQQGRNTRSVKLDARKVAEIRSLYGRLEQEDLAKRYGVTQSCISRVLSGDTWS